VVLRTDIAPITRTTTHAARSAAKFVPAPLPISKTAALAPKFRPSTILLCHACIIDDQPRRLIL
jgi:hypothetical protein